MAHTSDDTWHTPDDTWQAAMMSEIKSLDAPALSKEHKAALKTAFEHACRAREKGRTLFDKGNKPIIWHEARREPRGGRCGCDLAPQASTLRQFSSARH